ncbi:4385_t:CDS:1, partial [Funneliformis geosporum]
EINIDQINILMKKYNVTITSKPKYPLMKALLSFHILKKIMEEVELFFKKNNDSSSVLHLEADIMSKSKMLEKRLVEFSKTRNEKDSITQTASIKIRQEVNIALSNRGFSDVLNKNATQEHYFISHFKNILNEEMNKYRIIKDPAKKESIENMAPKLIRELIRIFWFR